jgi:hypothetical protein
MSKMWSPKLMETKEFVYILNMILGHDNNISYKHPKKDIYMPRT